MAKKKNTSSKSRAKKNAIGLAKNEVVVNLLTYDPARDRKSGGAPGESAAGVLLGIFDSYEAAEIAATNFHAATGYQPQDLDDDGFSPSGYRVAMASDFVRSSSDARAMNPEERRTKTQTIKVKDATGKLRKISQDEIYETAWKTAAAAGLGGLVGAGVTAFTGVPAFWIAGSPIGAWYAREYWVPEDVRALKPLGGIIGSFFGPFGALGAALGTYIGARWWDRKQTENNPYMTRQYRHLSADEVEELEDLLIAGQQAKVRAELAKSRGDTREAQRQRDRYARLQERMVALEERLHVKDVGRLKLNPGVQSSSLKRKLMR